jgi:dihydroorotase
MELFHRGLISMEKIVEKMCHNPAILFGVAQRGFLREGYKADITIVNPDSPFTVEKQNLLYRCGWSPFEGVTFRSRVHTTLVNGEVVYTGGRVADHIRGQQISFK